MKNNRRSVPNERRTYTEYSYDGRSEEEKCAVILDLVNEAFAKNALIFNTSSKKSHFLDYKRFKISKGAEKYIKKLPIVFRKMRKQGDLNYIKSCKFIILKGGLYLHCDLDKIFFNDVVKFDDPVIGFAYAYLKRNQEYIF
jgi:hypothetical protein